MKKRWMFFLAAMTALGITACGNGDGIVINGTTAAEAGSDQGGSEGSVSQETGAGTKIEIITEETTPAEETAAQSQESYSQEQVTQPETTAYVPQTTLAAAETTAAPTRAAGAAVSETTAARTYKVTDAKKTMYATASVRVRSSYSTSSSVLAALAEGEKVEVTGESENGWMRVNYKGNVGYVSKSYLTETVPATSAQTASAGRNGANTSGAGSTTGTGNTSASGNTSGSGTNGTSAGASSSTGSTQGTGAGTGSGTAPGTAGGSGAGPSANTGAGTSSGGKTGPSAGNGSGNTLTAGNTNGPGGNSGSTVSPGSTSGGNTSASGSASSGGNSVTGSVTALNPSGVTVQTSDGTSYDFVWGENTPDLEPGEKIQIFYETTGSGERRVTNYAK